jgi:hypothetical protein
MELKMHQASCEGALKAINKFIKEKFMNKQFIKTCSCCDKKFSHIHIPSISVKNQYKLKKKMQKEIEGMNFKGTFDLKSADGFITSFYYEYANEKEMARAEALCKRLFVIATYESYNLDQYIQAA